MESARIVIEGAGGPEVLRLVSWQIPELAADRVLVRVTHAGVSFGDVLLRRGVFRDRPKPAVPGYDVVGVVEASRAPGVAVGQRVAAFIEYGGHARHAIVHARDIVPLTEDVAGAEAAAVILNYPTAARMLELAGAARGDTVLVHGIRGGVGSAVNELGRRQGLRVLGTGRTHAPHEGVFAPSHPDFERALREAAPDGLAAVFDSSAEDLRRSHRLVRRGGVLIVFGLSAAAQPGWRARLKFLRGLAQIAWAKLLPRGRRTQISAIDQLYRREPERVRVLVAEQLELLARGEIRPELGAILPLERAAEAHRLLEAGKVPGKIVLTA